MGGVDLSDQRAVAYARLMRGVVWYYKVFFYVIEVCMSNAYILHCKSFAHTSISSLEFRKSVLKTLVEGKCFRRDTGLHQIPVAILSDIRFNRDHFHHLISHDTRSTCKVHIQEVKTVYTCAVCGECVLSLVSKGTTHYRPITLMTTVTMAPDDSKREEGGHFRGAEGDHCEIRHC